MECRECRFESRPGARFCGRCGAELSVPIPCPQCGVENPAAHVFCEHCGGSLRPQASEPGAAPPVSAERRQVTAIFCDLVGSTPLSQRIDAEILREIVRDYQSVATGVIERWGGHVAQYLGDGLLASFGYPVAHGDDAERAVRAAVELPQATTGLNRRLESTYGVRLAVRVGVHTGLAVVGSMGFGRSETLAVGDTLNICARLQSIAEPDTVVMSGTTRDLVRGRFVTKDLGEHSLKGVSEPMRVFQVLQATGLHERMPEPEHLTPFIARDQELVLLRDRWEHVCEGRGQVVLVTGDPGIGKTRLIQQLQIALGDQDHLWLDCNGSPYYRSSAFYPIVGLIQRGIGVVADDSDAVRAAKLAAAIDAAGFRPDESRHARRAFSSVLGLPVPDDAADTMESAEARRRTTLEALLSWLFALATRQPLVFVVEDLQWVDPSTLELLTMLIDQVATARILFVATSRPDVEWEWARKMNVTHLTLNPLTRRQSRDLLNAVISGKVLSDEVVTSLMEKCGGVPLYVEELTKAVVESPGANGDASISIAGRPGSTTTIPASLQDSLMARLDRLGGAREVAQVASVLGREFSHELLSAVAALDAEALVTATDALARAELLHRRGIPPRAVYQFKHVLIQEAAYQSLLRSRRAELHAAIARTLEERFPETAEHEPEVVAHHYDRAGQYAPAVAYYRRAGEQAKSRLANLEAIEHLHRAIDLLGRAPESDESRLQELHLQVALGAPLIATRGYAHDDVRRTFERALELCNTVGDATELFDTIYGLSTYFMNRGELGRALELSERLLDLAGRIPDGSRAAWAYQQLGCLYLFKGEAARAVGYFDQAVACFDDARDGPLLHVFGQDPVAASLALSGMARWLAGDADDAIRASLTAVDRARKVRHPFSLVFALCFCGYTHVQRGERDAVRAVAEEAERLVEEQALSLWRVSAAILRGWATEDPETGIELIRSGLALAVEGGARIGGPFQLCMLGDRYVDAGRVDDAVQTFSLALHFAEETANHFWDAEIHRVLGELEGQLAAARSDQKAEEHFRQALAVARAQGAPLLELRAVVSLARLVAARGQRNEARELLTPLQVSFDGAPKTADEKAAAALLAELS